MGRKILLTLLSAIIGLSIIGCEKKVAKTGDPDLDAAIQEIQDAIEEDVANETSEELDTKNTTNIDIQESYLVNRDGKNYMVIYFSQEIPYDSFTELIVKGVNSGSEKELDNGHISLFLLKPFAADYLRIPFFNSPTDKVLAFEVDWDGYEEYLLTIQQYKDIPGEPNKISNERTYSIDNTRFVKISYEDLIKTKTQELFEKVNYEPNFSSQNLKFKYLGSDFSSEPYTLNFTVTNEGDVPSEKCSISTAILTKDGNVELIYNKANDINIGVINPGETINFTFEHKPKNKVNAVPGDDFVFEIKVENTSMTNLDIIYFKSKF